MNINIKELIKEGIINSDTGNKIIDYYSTNEEKNKLKQYIIFAVIGALLIGLGIISIVAHNWDNINTANKLIISFAPLLIAQLFCAYVLVKQKNNKSYLESASLLLSLSVAASISLVSQTYNIIGSLDSFLLIWMLLSLPLVYLFKSKSVSILYIVTITCYAWINSYTINDSSYTYWLLLMLIAPFYYYLYKNNKSDNSFKAHSWLISLSISICLGSMAFNGEGLISIAYISLFVAYILIGNLFFKEYKNNAYSILGTLSLLFSLVGMSFHSFWTNIKTTGTIPYNFSTNEYIASIFVTAICAALLYYKYKNSKLTDIKIIDISFILFIIIFITGLTNTYIATILCNILILSISVSNISKGSKTSNLGLFNLGLVNLIILIACRFFDINISFIYRGILFIMLGSGFFIINYYMLKKTQKND